MPSRHKLFASSLLCGLFLLLFAAASPSQAGERPNILFLFTDDQAPWALGLSEHPHAQTPNLDRLFLSGARLTSAFTVTPVCSPSRASLMTSRYGSELGITDWINPRKEPELGLDSAHPTWPKLLADAGYECGLIGKWHLGLEDRHHPSQFGFSHFMGFRGGGNVPKDPTLEVDGQQRKLQGFLPDLLVDNALGFLRRASEKEAPFLLSVHFRAPHARWLPVADADWNPFKDLDPTIPNPDYPKLDVKRVKRMTREYLASVASVDRNVGRMLEELERLKLADSTIVVFSSDHGYNMGHNGIWHKGNGHWVLTEPPPATETIPRNQRPNMYDHSIRVPTCIRWPGVIAPRTVIAETTSNLDWFPTFLEIAGVTAPAGVPVRGRSLVPLLKGDASDWDNGLYAEYSTHHQSQTHMRMYRTPRWKLIRDFHNQGRDELYDLTADPAEATNLISSQRPEHRQVTQDLHTKILQHMEANEDAVLNEITAARGARSGE